MFVCRQRSTCRKCFYVTLNLRVYTYAIFHNANLRSTSTCTALRFYVYSLSTSSAVALCLHQFGLRSDNKRYKPAQHTTTGWRTYKDSTTTNYTCCKDLSVNAFFHVRATHLTRQVGSLPLAKNAKHSSSWRAKRAYLVVLTRQVGSLPLAKNAKHSSSI